MDEHNAFTVFDGDDVNEEGNRMYPALPAGKIAIFLDKELGKEVLAGIFNWITTGFSLFSLYEAANRASQWAKRVAK